MTLHYELNERQFKELFSLCYWHGEMKYFVERNDRKSEYYDLNYDRYHNNIVYCFERCDYTKIPFWVQNTVLSASDTYEKYYHNGVNESDLKRYLEKRNITVKS